MVTDIPSWTHCIPISFGINLYNSSFSLIYYGWSHTPSNLSFHILSTPFSQNLLCNSLTQCINLNPFITMSLQIANNSGAVHQISSAACVKPPFVFLLSDNIHPNCSIDRCYFSDCWNGSFTVVFLLIRPPVLWIPFDIDDFVYPLFQSQPITDNSQALSRNRRDFGITAALIAIFITALAATAAAAAALTQTTLTATTLNNLTQTTATALTVQLEINDVTHQAILNLQQQIDLLAQELDAL